jgi:hypothetical protein
MIMLSVRAIVVVITTMVIALQYARAASNAMATNVVVCHNIGVSVAEIELATSMISALILWSLSNDMNWDPCVWCVLIANPNLSWAKK